MQSEVLPMDLKAHQQVLYNAAMREVHARTDRQFAVLLALEWVVAIVLALVVSPRTWAGTASAVHLHVWAAVGLGAVVCLFPAYLGWRHPGESLTRYAVAIGQASIGALFIHLSGGRIETHFHVFVSLGFLAMYRDWRVLLAATVVIATDHLWRGIFWPESVFGVLTSSPWRVLEHASWVIFEDIGLIRFCLQIEQDMSAAAQKQAEVEQSEARVSALLDEVREKSEQMAAQQAASEENHRQTEAERQFLLQGVEVLRSYASGDLSKPMANSAADRVGFGQVVNAIRDNLNSLLNECQQIGISSANGQLAVQGNAARFNGQFKAIISEINATLNNLRGPVESAIQVLNAIAQGDLSRRMEGHYKGDFKTLQESLNGAGQFMGGIVGEAKNLMREISNESQEMAASSNRLSDGASRQATSVSEIAESIREIETQTDQSLSNVNKVNELSANTATAADQGNNKMVNMLSAMQAISEDSNKISSIVKTIDEIAFQTNLLALNAAVEAARAGVHGKGFAVVAEEVRNLAQRSARAARET
ncbi:MAG TPA: methyl-accepting chemotaxis protein, partial [Calditrichia bacterium]|nr:methyl-accepting chemotaxis protein [Calditrichia bacterium]